MKEVLKNKLFKISALTTIMLVLLINMVNAAQVEVKKEYTEEYKRWLELPKEERKNYIEPSKYSINYAEKKDKNRLFASKYQSKYSLLNDINVKVKDQQNTGSCWAFSTTTVLETNLAKTLGRKYEFSPRHMEYSTSRFFRDGINEHGYNREVGIGGNPRIGLAYVTAGYGPVLETDMPFENNNNRIYLSQISNKNVPIQVEEYIDLPSLYKEYNSNGTVRAYTNGYSEDSGSRIEYKEDLVTEIRDKIKSHILNYGAISTKTYMYNDKYLNKSDSLYEYYCGNNSETANHAVTIVGWDDTYKKENFSSTYGKPVHDGAYIVLNSWGTSWGNSGYYYVSYDDSIIENTLYGVTKTKDKKYDNIYQHDILGSNQVLGYSWTNTAYMGNVFKRANYWGMEELNEISFQLFTKSKVKIYVNPENGNLNINNLIYMGEMNNLDSGYHTFKFNSPVALKNDTYAVVLKVTNINFSWLYFLGESRDYDGIFSTANIGIGESFSSPNGTDWEDVGYKNINYTIKAFTKNCNEVQNIEEASVEAYNWKNSYTYTGSEIRPIIRVKHKNTYLRENIDYTIDYQNNINVGTSTISIIGKGYYQGTINLTFGIEKANNPGYIIFKNKNVKYKNVKKKKQNVSPIKVYNAQGTVKYYKKSGNKNFSINKNTGKITIKKKTKKGTYKIKAKITVDGNSNYYGGSKTVTFKIKIK